MEPRLGSFLYAKGCPTEDVRDLLQETAYRACSRVYSLTGDMEPWIWSIARHVFSEYIRERKKYPVSEDCDEIVDNRPNPDSLGLIKQLFRQALNELDPLDRMCLIMHDLEGFVLEEISKKVGKSRSNCHYRIERAKGFIRGKFPDLIESHYAKEEES